MKKLVLQPTVRNENDSQLTSNEILSSMQKLRSVEVDATSNGTLLVPLINENIPNHLHF